MTNSGYTQSGSTRSTLNNKSDQHTLRRLSYVGAVPLLAFVVLLALFGFLGMNPSAVQAAGDTYFVIETGTAANACTAIDPCSLARAVDLAVDGDEIHVAEGSYVSLSSAPVLSVTESLTVTGGYVYNAGSWSTVPDPGNITTLDGNDNGRVVEIGAGVSPIIENFHVQNGRSTEGAGIYIADGDGRAIIRHNAIHDNIATGGSLGGGGIYDGGGSTIAYNKIYNNDASPKGAGIFIHNDSATIFSTLSFNEIYANEATDPGNSFGGGIFLYPFANAHFVGNEIYENRADIGGGLAVNGAQFSMYSNLMYLNEANAFGGAIWADGDGTIWNNTIVSNTAASNGGGLYLEAGTVEIHNTIIALNSSPGNDGLNNDNGRPATVTGSFNNVFDDVVDSSGVTFTAAVVGDPAFVNAAAHNYHLTAGSVAHNTGSTSTPAAVDVDIDGQVRPNPDDLAGGIPRHEVGADEYYPDFREVSIEPESSKGFVERNTTAVFTHTIRNEGSLDDTYDIACTNIDWAIDSCVTSLGPLAPGETTVFNTQVLVPAGAQARDVATTRITATSQVSSSVFARATVRSVVAPHPGISFTPNYSRTELPGDVITLTHVLTNTGDDTEHFIITKIADTYGWGALLPTDPYTIGINAGAARTVQVQITVPDFAPQGLANVVSFQASSQFDPNIFDTVVNTITAKATTGTRYVAFGGSDTDNNCTQSDTPCGSIKHAVGQATSGDEIRIGEGEFTENNINVNDTLYISGGWENFGSDGQGEKPNPTLTKIDGAASGAVFVIGAGNPTFSDLTVQNGRSVNGGAVFVNANTQPSFTNLIFDHNTATNNGGALFMNSGTAVTIQKSQFSNNDSANGGGAIYMNGGTLSLQQSQLITNTANSSGGGALTLNNGLLTVQNSLFHNNIAPSGRGGAVRLNNGTATFDFNTWVNNSAAVDGGGVYNHAAAATIENSIFAANSAVSGSAVYGNGGTTTLDYLNLWQNDTNVSAGSHSFTANPLFADEMFRLGTGSPAIDTAAPYSTLTVDFEDDFRPSDEGYDIGYDERAGCRAKRGDVVYGSIQDAVDADDPSALIQVSGICRGVHTIDVGDVPISQTVHLTKSVTIQGGWNGDFSKQYVDPTLVDPEGRGRGFYVTDGVSVTLETITVTNGTATGLGGGPADEDAGGGFYNVDGAVTLRGVRILTSTAAIGAGFYNDSGSPLITWHSRKINGEDVYTVTQIASGTAVSGGGVYNNSGEMVLDGVWLHHNQATANGGGLFNLTGPMTVVNTILDTNTATLGAGVYNEAPTAAYLHMTVFSNTAVSEGGGFYNAAGQPLLANNIFESNQAPSGSAVYDDANAAVDYNYYYLNGGTAVAGNAVTGTHSIETNTTAPGLIDPLAANFHLMEEAPAADVADPDSPVPTDFEEDPRPSNQGFDMGADEVVGCLVQLNGTIYGSLQAAIDDAQPGDTIKVSGTCSGVHLYDPGTGAGNACGGAVQTAVHITKNIIISGGWDDTFSEQGEGTYSTLDAKNLGRVMYIGQGVSTTIESFALINGLAANGAGICIDNAQPTLLNNHIYSNTATNDGGGIYSLDSTPLLDSGNHIYNNEASAGGGLYLTGGGAVSATLQNNFVYANSATNGAGIYNASGSHNYWHNTLYGNIATGSGGAYHIASGTPDIRGSILMANEAASGGAIHAISSPTVAFNDYFQNLPSDFSGGGIANGGVGSIAADPLFHNPISGVFTITIDSPVVDFDIPAMPVVTDFEGDLRPSHQGYDMGADEVGGCFAAIQGAEDTVYGSVQLAVDLAADGDTVLVDGICLGAQNRQVGANNVAQTVLFTKSVTIDGSWEYPADKSTVTTTLDALENGRVVYVDSGATVTITNLIMRQGDANGAGNGNNGGGVYNAGSLTIVDAWVQENTAVSGAGLYNAGTLIVDSSSVMTNTAAQDGGGLYSNGLDTQVLGSNFRNNRMGANGNGGGIYQQAGTLMVDGNRLHVNGYNGSPGGNGGAVYLNSGTGDSVDVRNNFIYDNWANEGGGLYNADTNGRLWHNTFHNNSALNNIGGGLASLGGDPDIRNNIADSNSGHGIYTQNGSPRIDFNNAVNNTLDDFLSDASIGANNISASPTYVDPFEENFHLFQGSRGEDEGDPDVADTNNTHYVIEDIDGHTRPTNSAPDIGADEIDSCRVRVGDQIFSVLQDAIDYAEGNPSLNKVEIARGECRGTFERNGMRQVAYVTQDLVFVGSLRRLDFADLYDYGTSPIGTNSTIINANGEGRVFFITNTATVSFTHMALVNGDAIVADASADDNGGGFYLPSGEAYFKQVFICNNVAENGGGYYADSNTVTDMTGNTLGRCTPAQVLEDPVTGDVLSVRRISFGGNGANTDGGAAYMAGESNLRNNGVISNQAGLSGISGNGGGIYNAGSNNNRIINTFFSVNATPFDGGGLYNAGDNFRMLHNTLRNNIAGGLGGGIANDGSNFELNSSILYSNTAVSDGGGLYSTGSPTLAFNNFYDNVPNDSTVGLGSNPYTWNPKLLGSNLWGYRLSVTSPNIDRADPSLLGEVVYDINVDDRPDGNENLDYQPPHGLFSDVGADEYYKDFGCEIDAPRNEYLATPGEVVTYTLNIINVGYPPYTNLDDGLAPRGFTDTITITLDSQVQGWSVFEGGEVQTVELGWQDWFPNGEWATRILTVTVPVDAQVGRGETTVIGCQSASLPIERTADSVEIVTEIGNAGGVLVVPDKVATAVPGQVITYEQTIINQQNEAATYLLTPSSGPQHANAVILDSLTLSPTANITATLAPSGTVGYTSTAFLEITILDTATAGDVAKPGLVAQDITDPINKQGASIHQITILPLPGTRYVADIGADTTNCTDPLQPCATIQYAIDQALAGDEVLVAAGTYTHYTTETVGLEELQQNVFIDKSITLRGGYTAVGDDPFTVQEPITNAVILDAENGRRGIYVANGISATISSLFIQNGDAAQSTSLGDSTYDYGGGLYNVNGNLTITATWFLNNAAKIGGGLYQETGNLLLNNSVFADNTNDNPAASAVNAGGAGLYISATAAILENNTFVNNRAEMGNDSGLTGEGNAIYQREGQLTLVNQIFSENEMRSGKHAVYITGTAPIFNDAYNLYYTLYPTQTNDINVTPDPSSVYGDPDFIDSTYHISASSAALDAGTTSPADVRPALLTSGDYELQARVQGASIDIGADERVQEPNFVFEPPAYAGTINADETITYEHTLTNTGDFVDSYTLTMTQQVIPNSDPSWSASFAPNRITNLGIGDSVTVTVVITGGAAGYQHVATVEAVSDSGLSASVQDTTTVSQTAVVEIEQSEAASGVPGQLITYTHTLTNAGDGLDEFALTATAVPTDWVVSLLPAQTGFLTPSQSIPVTVTVLVPADALSGTQHVVTVTAVAEDPFASDTLTDTTTVALVSDLTLEPDNARNVADGMSTVYTHTLTSSSNIVDTILLTATGSLPSWGVSIEPEAVVMNPLETRTISVTVNVPANTGGLSHTTLVTATSSVPGLTASATDTTTVPIETGILFTPNLTETVDAGSTAAYTHTLTNLGNLTDTFNIISSSVPGWPLAITDGPLTVGPGASVPVTAVVTVPLTATYPMEDVLQITAVSQTDAATTATVTDTTIVRPFVDLTFIPDHDEAGVVGTTKVYTHSLTNEGEADDIFDLTYTGTPAWLVTFAPSASVAVASGETAVITANLTIPNGAAGRQNVTIITATSALDTSIWATVVNTTTVPGTPATLGVDIAPDGSESGYTDDTITYYHTVTNTGTGIDDINVSVDASGWANSINPATIMALAPNASAPVTVTVTIPGTALAGDMNVATVTAASGTDETVFETAVNTTTVLGPPPTYRVLIEPDREDNGVPGQTLTYTHTLTNLGQDTDDINLSANSGSWVTGIEPNAISGLAAGASVPVTVTVMIPPSAVAGDEDMAVITAVSQSDLSASSSVTDTTTAVGIPPLYGVLIEPDRSAEDFPGQTVIYHHTVTNTGNMADDIDLTVSFGWATTIDPSQIIGLAPNASVPVTVTVTISPTAMAGDEDMALVTAVSRGNPSASSSVTDTTTVTTTLPSYGVIIAPDRSGAGIPGQTITYYHTVTNTGDVADSFTLSVNPAWGATVAPAAINNLAANASTPVTVTVTIPAGAAVGDVHETMVTAVSQSDLSASSSATDTTTVVETPPPTAGVVIEPDQTKYGVGGDEILYVHTVTNTGSAEAIFHVGIGSSSSGWAFDVAPFRLTLGSNETAQVTLTVSIPPATHIGARDVTIVTVTSATDLAITDSVVDTTIVPGVFLPMVMKASGDVVTPTPTPSPTTTVTTTPSPTTTVTITPPPCTTPTGIDLIVTEIRVEPATPTAGVPAMVYVTIRNVGTVNVAPTNNFYLDFYVDQEPARYLMGAIEWGVQGELMGAGQSATFSGNFTFGGGQHQLWAQVDTDDTVDECPDDYNNVMGPLTLTVSGTSSMVGEENSAQPSQPNDGPRPTPEDLLEAEVEPVITERPLSTPPPPSIDTTPTPPPTSSATPPPN